MLALLTMLCPALCKLAERPSDHGAVAAETPSWGSRMTKPQRPLPLPLLVAGFLVAGLVLVTLAVSAPDPPWRPPIVAPVVGPRYVGGGGTTVTVLAAPVVDELPRAPD